MFDCHPKEQRQRLFSLQSVKRRNPTFPRGIHTRWDPLLATSTRRNVEQHPHNILHIFVCYSTTLNNKCTGHLWSFMYPFVYLYGSFIDQILPYHICSKLKYIVKQRCMQTQGRQTPVLTLSNKEKRKCILDTNPNTRNRAVFTLHSLCVFSTSQILACGTLSWKIQDTKQKTRCGSFKRRG